MQEVIKRSKNKAVAKEGMTLISLSDNRWGVLGARSIMVHF
jgi:hypothetical protein